MKDNSIPNFRIEPMRILSLSNGEKEAIIDFNGDEVTYSGDLENSMFDDKPKDLITKIKYKYWEICPHYLRPMTMWYNFKCWAWHRYGTIRCRHLPHTGSDRRTILLHASFQILTDFIDKECSPGHVLWYGEGEHQVMVNGVMENVMDEMKELYYWWNTVYLKDYPTKIDALWEAAKPFTPVMRCVPYEDMHHNIAGKLVMKYKNDKARSSYKAIMNDINKIGQLIDEKSEEMLKRLAAVRLWMWT